MQKYRLGMHIGNKDLGTDLEKDGFSEDRLPANESMHTATSPTLSNLEINKTLAIQLEVQKQLQEQLEIQRQLQVQIEAQSKYLQFILEKTRETFTGHIAASPGLEAAQAELTDLATKVSLESYGTSLPALEFSLPESPRLTGTLQHPHFTDLTTESKLTKLGVTGNHKRSNSDFEQGPTKKVKAFFCDGNGRIWKNEDDGDAKLQGYSCQSQKDETENRLAKVSEILPAHSTLLGIPGYYDQSVEEDDGHSSSPCSTAIKEDCLAAHLPVVMLTSCVGNQGSGDSAADEISH
ncbi:hypothetical protein O6H91_12G057200 [Diphasiastrum complanatum]|uniref:Uncharacterized protein n=1 Tax=Diphasiastrum complanatum TaxID=34168 RepID=A0ACC2C2N5_DIPCM|nr:hypothetical protein O6H91_12G057200 [Diphasiastrum complanatum]